MEHGITFIEGGFRPAIAKVGHKWTHIVFIDGSRVRVIRERTNSREPIRFRPIQGYTIERLAKAMLKKTNSLGLPVTITKGARRVLREALS